MTQNASLHDREITGAELSDFLSDPPPEQVRLKNLVVSGPVRVAPDTRLAGLIVQNCRFDQGLDLSEVEIDGSLMFFGSTLETPAGVALDMFQTTVGGGFSFGRGSRCLGDLSIVGSKISDHLLVDNAVLRGEVGLHAVTIGGDLRLAGGRFTIAPQICDVRLTGSDHKTVSLVLAEDMLIDGLIVDGPIDLQLKAPRIDLSSLRIRDGGRLSVNSADLRLHRAAFGGHTVLGRLTDPDDSMRKAARFHGKLSGSPQEAPIAKLRLLSSVDCANLEICRVDLSELSFADASNVGKLRIDTDLQLRAAPGGWHTRRKILHDEAVWRGWATGECRASLDISEAYRQLRSGIDDAKAGDLYYGEMDMRRLGTPWGTERLVLTLYWLISGYGTRAWRGLASWLVLLSAATTVFANSWPEAAHAPSLGQQLWRGFRHAFEASTALMRGVEGSLQPGVAITEWMLRLLTPALIGLAALALSNRVKRTG